MNLSFLYIKVSPIWQICHLTFIYN